jgi:hypothetical protein
MTLPRDAEIASVVTMDEGRLSWRSCFRRDAFRPNKCWDKPEPTKARATDPSHGDLPIAAIVSAALNQYKARPGR